MVFLHPCFSARYPLVVLHVFQHESHWHCECQKLGYLRHIFTAFFCNKASSPFCTFCLLHFCLLLQEDEPVYILHIPGSRLHYYSMLHSLSSSSRVESWNCNFCETWPPTTSTYMSCNNKASDVVWIPAFIWWVQVIYCSLAARFPRTGDGFTLTFTFVCMVPNGTSAQLMVMFHT